MVWCGVVWCGVVWCVWCQCACVLALAPLPPHCLLSLSLSTFKVVVRRLPPALPEQVFLKSVEPFKDQFSEFYYIVGDKRLVVWHTCFALPVRSSVLNPHLRVCLFVCLYVCVSPFPLSPSPFPLPFLPLSPFPPLSLHEALESMPLLGHT